MMKRAVRLLFVLLLMAAVAGAEAQDAEFLHLTPREGLSDGWVWPILQSQDGYMWFGTASGLNRYDGYEVTRFMHDPGDEGSISRGMVIALLESPDGTIWAGTASGLSRMDRSTGRFMTIEFDTTVPADSQRMMMVGALHRTDDGTLWVGTDKGLYALAEENGAVLQHFDAASGGSDDAVPIHAIEEAENGTLWVATLGSGLIRLDPTSGEKTHFRHDPDSPGSITGDELWIVHIDRFGQLWAGVQHGGLCRFNDGAETFDCLRHDPDDPTSLSADNVAAIFEADDGRLWLGTDPGGVSILDPDTGTFSFIRHDPTNPASLGEDDVHYIFQDRFGTMWFAHHHAGVSRMTPGTARFETTRVFPDLPPTHVHNQLVGSLEGSDGTLWFTTAHGLVRHDPATGISDVIVPFPDRPVVETFADNPNFLSPPYEDRDGRLWAGNGAGGLMVLEPGASSFRFADVPEHDDWVEVLDEDGRGNLWITAAEIGLWRLNLETEEIVEYRARSAGGDAPIGDYAIGTVADDGTFRFWSADGIEMVSPRFHRYDAEQDGFVEIPVDLSEIADGSFGIPVPGRSTEMWLLNPTGFAHVNLETLEVRSFPRAIYDVGSGSRALAPGSDGRIWYGDLSGRFGVFDPERGATVAFDRQHGLELPRYYMSLRLRTGELLFTGHGGYVRFDPAEITPDGVPPQVHVVAVHAGGEPVDLGEDPRLAHDQSTLAFDFVALHYADPARNQYRYRLSGFDTDWNRVGNQRRALYPQLPPGRYAFEVQAAGRDGVWTDEGARVEFAVLPPWWRTWWAYGFYAVILLAGGLAVDRVQRRRLVARERERARERELEQAREIEKAYESLKAAQAQLVQQEKLASLGALTAGIAHEIKNPLNFVNNFGQLSSELVEELREAVWQEPRDEKLIAAILDDLGMNTAKIEEHGKRADAIVRSMLQHSRGGSGARDVVPLNQLVDEYVGLAYHGRRAQQPDFNVTLTRDLDPDAGELEAVPQDLGRVILNVVSNAFDATDDRARSERDTSYEPHVRISTLRRNGDVVIRIEDNGPGIPEDVRDKIFEPFFTTKPAGQGTGLGLSMSHDIIHQGHHGQMLVESEPGNGTSFIITLPVT